MPPIGWFLVLLVMFLLHQDVWFWRQARPLVFGFLPVGLAYHATYCLGVGAVMWALTRYAWPDHLEMSGEGPSPAVDPLAGGRPRREAGVPPR